MENGDSKPGPSGVNKGSIEQIYQKKTQLEHILLRPDTYIGLYISTLYLFLMLTIFLKSHHSVLTSDHNCIFRMRCPGERKNVDIR